MNLPPAGRFPSLRFAAALACVACAGRGVRADDWAPNLTFAAGWNNNATNADAPADEIGAFKFTGDLLASQRYPYGRDDSAHASFHLAGDWWPRFNGLTSGAIGLRGEWRHKFGVHSLAPILSLEGSADAVASKEGERRGTATALTLAVRKRFNDLTRGTLSQEFSWFDARSSTFDRAASETTLEIDRDLTDVVGSSRVDLQACKLEYSIVSPK